MRKYITLIQLLFAVQCWAQDPITLDHCYETAMKNHPWTSQTGYYQQIEELNKKSINSAWYPTFTLGGQATWQSDVTKLDLNLPENSPIKIDAPTPSKQQWKATLEVKQTIYDGGLSKGKRQVEEADFAVNTQQVAVEIDKVKDAIDKVYFSLLLNDKLVEQLQTSKETLTKRRQIMESYIRNGVMLKTDLDAFDAEILSIDQKLMELDISKTSSFKVLATLTGDSSLVNTQKISQLTTTFVDTDSINRKELQLFDLQSKKLDASTKILSAGNRPRVFAFSTLGYGNPGLNIFKEGAQPYGIVGVGFSWNLIDWGKASHDRQVLQIQKLVVETKRNDFNRSISVALQQQKSEIKKLQAQLATDEKLVELREKVTRTVEHQNESGTATTLDYITQFNKQKDATISMEIHKIQLQKAIADYKYLAGN